MNLKSILSGIAKTMAMAIACAGPLTLTGGCSRSNMDAPSIFRIIAVDTSGSAEPDLIKYRRFAYRLVHELRRNRDAVRVVRFDYNPYEILSTLGQRKEALLATLATQLKVPAERSSTRLAKLYERIVELMNLPEAQGKRIEIFILSDNGNDDLSPQMARLCQDSAEKIASNQGLSRITYWGVKTRFAEQIPAPFSKLPEGVLTVQFNSEAFARR